MNHVRIENKQVALFDCGVSDGSGSVCECNLDYAKPKNEYYEDFSFAIPSSPEPAKGKNSLKIYLNNAKVRHNPKVKPTKENCIENKWENDIVVSKLNSSNHQKHHFKDSNDKGTRNYWFEMHNDSLNINYKDVQSTGN